MEGENAFCVFCTCHKLVSLTHLHLVTRDKMKKIRTTHPARQSEIRVTRKSLFMRADIERRLGALL